METSSVSLIPFMKIYKKHYTNGNSGGTLWLEWRVLQKPCSELTTYLQIFGDHVIFECSGPIIQLRLLELLKWWVLKLCNVLSSQCNRTVWGNSEDLHKIRGPLLKPVQLSSFCSKQANSLLGRYLLQRKELWFSEY